MDIKEIAAKDIMSEVVISIAQSTRIKDAVHLMLRERINGVPVVDQDKKIVGVLTLANFFNLIGKILENGDSDFLSEVIACKQLEAEGLMSKNVFTVEPTTTLDKIIALMIEKKIHTFPVMENGALVGIVGRHDVLNAIFAYS